MRRVALLVVALALTACPYRVRLDVQSPATLASEPPGFEEGRVVRVIDGDTIEVEIAERASGAGAGGAGVGTAYDVRLLGIDAPESVKPRSPVECFGRESSAAARALLEGRRVRLVRDVENVDHYDRLLRYVYLGHEMANARLVANGYAHAFTYPPNVRHADLFVALEREARRFGHGLWSADTCDGDT